MADRPVVLAAVAGAHGVAGEVRLKLFTKDADSVRRHESLDAGGRPLTLTEFREGRQGPIVRFAEITTRNDAEALRGTLLSVPRASLPPLAPDEYYWHDLIGLQVVLPDGSMAGTVCSVENYGASDLLDIERTDGRRVLVPLVPDIVPEFSDPLVIGPEWLAG